MYINLILFEIVFCRVENEGIFNSFTIILSMSVMVVYTPTLLQHW